MATTKKKVTVWTCPEHGEYELVDHPAPQAYCPICGKLMTKGGDYEE
jgi:rubrerythrin